nr:hypothetical protein [Micromonospora sp. DSM 115978]
MTNADSPGPRPARRPGEHRRINQSRRHDGVRPRQPTDLTRITINLTARTVAALDDLLIDGRTNKTDAINHAIRINRLLRRYADHHGIVTVRTPDGRSVDIEVL